MGRCLNPVARRIGVALTQSRGGGGAVGNGRPAFLLLRLTLTVTGTVIMWLQQEIQSAVSLYWMDLTGAAKSKTRSMRIYGSILPPALKRC